MQWSIGLGRPNFYCSCFFPLVDEVLGLLIKVDVGAKRYREQLSNLLQFSYSPLFGDIARELRKRIHGGACYALTVLVKRAEVEHGVFIVLGSGLRRTGSG